MRGCCGCAACQAKAASKLICGPIPAGSPVVMAMGGVCEFMAHFSMVADETECAAQQRRGFNQALL